MPSSVRTVGAGLLIGIAAGLGIGAIAFSSSDEHGPGTIRPSGTRSVSLPATVAGFRDLVSVMSARGATAAQVKAQRDNQANVRAATVTAYDRAFAGAPAAYREYSDPRLATTVYAIAVRAAAPGLTIGPVSDPAFLGLATPEREVKTVGRVFCQIQWEPPTVAGITPPPSTERIVACQRSSSGVTVFTGGAGFAGPPGLQALAAFTDAAWRAAARG